MANLQVKDGAAATKYVKATGAGTDGDPYIPEHKETSAAAILAAAQAIEAAVEGALTVSGTLTANPTARAVTVAAGTASSSGDNTIIAAPGASLAIVLVSVQVQLEASTATVGLLKNGAGGSTLLRVRMAADGDGVLHQYAADARPKLTANTAAVLNLSGANQCGYTIHYYTEAA